MTSDQWDAAALRAAAGVLDRRARKRTFALRVIVRVLEREADRIDPGGPTVTASGDTRSPAVDNR